MQQLDNFRIVLVEPQHPGNIGAAARAMKAMGLSDLVLVAPQNFPHADATARAAGADDVLQATRCVASLHEAVADCQLVIGASARLRRLAWENLNPKSAASQASSLNGKTAFVFGRERSGLRNDELDLCQRHLLIPANPDYASLNLAAAVQVVCYELRMAVLEQEGSPDTSANVGEPTQAARVEDIEGFYQHLNEVLIAGGFLDPEQPKLLMRRFRRLFNRAQLETTEVNILRGVLTALDPRKRRP